jgi:hypothetical protein
MKIPFFSFTKKPSATSGRLVSIAQKYEKITIVELEQKLRAGQGEQLKRDIRSMAMSLIRQAK